MILWFIVKLRASVSPWLFYNDSALSALSAINLKLRGFSLLISVGSVCSVVNLLIALSAL